MQLYPYINEMFVINLVSNAVFHFSIRIIGCKVLLK